MGNHMSADELLEETLFHIGKPYFHQLIQDIGSLVDVVNHERTQSFIRRKLIQNHEELIELCEMKDVKSVYDLLRRLKILIEFYSMAIGDKYQFVWAGIGGDLAFLRDTDMSLNERVEKFINYLEFSIFNPKSTKIDKDINKFIETRQENMKLIYGISNDVSETADMERERVIRAIIDAESEEIREEYRQNMADLYLEKNSLVDELQTLFESIWRDLVSPECVSEYSKELQNYEGNGNKCKQFDEKGGAFSLQRKLDSSVFSLDQTNMKRFDYFHEDRSTESDDRMRHLVDRSNLDICLKKFIGRIDPWLNSMRKRIEKMPRKPLCLHKELITKEVERLSTFYYARMLNKPELVRDHEKILTELMLQAANEPRFEPSHTWMSVMPLISFEQFSSGQNINKQDIGMTFVLNTSNTDSENRSISTELEKLFDVRSVKIVIENGVKVIKFIKAMVGNVHIYVYRRIHELADLKIPAAFIGDYGLKVQRAMNPSYFRIYSIRAVDRADGFMSTYFSEFEDRGGEPYFCPNGWKRFSLDVGEMSDEMYADWPVAYHGTKKALAQQILMSSLKSSGKCPNLPEGGGAVFLSPSIEYSGHPFYAGVWKTDNKGWIKNKYIQVILQVRVKKERIFNKIEGTIPGACPSDPPCDPNFADNRKMEWIIKWPPEKLMNAKDGLLVYGIMLRVTDEHPCKLPQNRWWEKSKDKQWKEDV